MLRKPPFAGALVTDRTTRTMPGKVQPSVWAGIMVNQCARRTRTLRKQSGTAYFRHSHAQTGKSEGKRRTQWHLSVPPTHVCVWDVHYGPPYWFNFLPGYWTGLRVVKPEKQSTPLQRIRILKSLIINIYDMLRLFVLSKGKFVRLPLLNFSWHCNHKIADALIT